MKALSRRKLGQTLLALIASSPLRGLNVHEPLPHFSARTMDGERISSDSVKGKGLLLDFWATWCPPCKSDEPAVENIVKEFSPKGLVLAEDTTLAAICDAHSYPLYVLSDREGMIVGMQKGAAGEGALRRLVAKAGLESE